MVFEDTICAPATIAGTGAITVIRVSGASAFHIADTVIRCKNGTISDSAGYVIKFGEVSDDGQTLDEVLVSIFRAPHSYTGEDSVEISCHASRYICSRIMELLCLEGARPASPGEFTQRAFANGKMDLAQAEAVADVIASQSKASLRVAMSQLKGGISKELHVIREQLLEITSLLELELDFSEEDVEFADRSRLMGLVAEASSHITRLADSFSRGNAIKNGVPVAIIGATNTGKSTLLNALLGEDRAIVSDIAGTTRDTIEETLNIEGNLFRFIDTAGIRETDETIEKIGIERSLKALSQATIVIGVVDGTLPASEFETAVKDIRSKVDFDSQHLILVRSKSDLFGDLKPLDGILDISAAEGRNLDTLKASIASLVSDSGEDEVLISNARHHSELLLGLSSLKRVTQALEADIPSDLVAQDLRDALYHLGTITGEISTDEVLGNIFAHFCIGK